MVRNNNNNKAIGRESGQLFLYKNKRVFQIEILVSQLTGEAMGEIGDWTELTRQLDWIQSFFLFLFHM
jgi:hypothetical protein